jgi:hypothetical protein
VRAPHAPPPEGFYRNINGVYDLLARPQAMSDIQLAKAPRVSPQVLEQSAAPLPPPCEPPPTANAPAAKPSGPTPCPATR